PNYRCATLWGTSARAVRRLRSHIGSIRYRMPTASTWLKMDALLNSAGMTNYCGRGAGTRRSTACSSRSRRHTALLRRLRLHRSRDVVDGGALHLIRTIIFSWTALLRSQLIVQP